MSGRCFISLNMAMTADGKTTSAAREYPRFTSEADRANMDRVRAEADAVLIGAGTLRADDPPLGLSDRELRRQRQSLGKSPLCSVVVTRDLDLDPAARFFTAAPGRCIVATVRKTSDRHLAEISERAEVWRLGEETVDLPALVARLYGEGIERLLVEGGAELNWSFLAADLLDEIHLTVAPALLGGRRAPSVIGGAGLTMAEQRRLELLAVRQVGDEIFCRYRVRR